LDYRADIDGLRAVAIGAVLLFHAGIPGFKGGFVGVDVFFVISGFLITSIILKAVDGGGFSIFQFYERRIRRIFPALFPVLGFTLIAAVVLFNAIDFKTFGASVTATTMFFSNFLFLHQDGYFDAASTTKPLLHTWSLAVEEQFYIVFPWLLVMLKRLSPGGQFKWILGLALASLAASMVGTYIHPVAAFYLVPARAWELLFGTLLAFQRLPQPRSILVRNLLAILGLGFILFSVTRYSPATRFPGAAALVPVLGASLIIHCGTGGSSAVGRLLSVRPMVYVGLTSYALYLWHWPLLVFAKSLVFRDLTVFEGLGILLAAFAISAFSLRFIEQPFRGPRTVLASRGALFILAAAAMCITATAGGLIFQQGGMPYRNAKASALIAAATRDPEWDDGEKYQRQSVMIKAGQMPASVGSSAVAPSFMVWGDSHARALVPALSIQALQHGLSGFIATRNDHPPLLDVDLVFINSSEYFDDKYNKEVLSFVTRHDEIRTVILAGIWERYANGAHFLQKDGATLRLKGQVGDHAERSNAALLAAGLTRTVLALRRLGREVIVVSDVPDLGYGNDAARICWVDSQLSRRAQVLLPTLSEYRQRNAQVYAMLRGLAEQMAITVVYPESRLFDPAGRFIIAENNKLFYRDDNHLSTQGAKFIAPVFDQVFSRMAMERSGGPGLP
jgi:peptidoglycan/LPS O-acetylase OafA/YrhL